MIVTPEFLNHWQTRRLIEITKNGAAPLAVLRLWAFCQTSRRWEFPDMTADQLQAVCHWGDTKPACHIALVKAGYVDRLKKGFAAHNWQIANKQLIQKWQCGMKGGRKKKTESEPAETDRFEPGSRPPTESEPTRQDQIRLDEKTTSNVNIVNPSGAEADLTKLTADKASKVAMQRIAKDIASNRHGWSYDNCKVQADQINAASIKKILEPFAGQLSEKSIHECWQESVTRAHKATVDELAKNPVGYCIGCFKDELSKAIKIS